MLCENARAYRVLRMVRGNFFSRFGAAPAIHPSICGVQAQDR
jgi:hypothetical protein